MGTVLTAAVRRHRTAALVSADSAILACCYLILGVLRYEDGAVPWRGLSAVISIAIALHLVLCWQTKLYQGRTMVASNGETVLLGVISLVTAAAVSVVNIVVLSHMVARSIPLGAALTAGAMMVLLRALWRGHAARLGLSASSDARRAVIIGAGEAGQQLIQSMLRTPNSPYVPLLLLDDDPWKRHFRWAGVQVRGTLADLEAVVNREGPDVVVVVAIPTATRDIIGAVTERCTKLGVDIKVLPPVEDLLGDRVSIRDVRDINVADLLGRNAIETDIESIADFLNGKRVLVTGAGGSIGSELCRQISKWHPAELMMLDRDESGLHGVQLSIHGHALLDSADVILCDIRDSQALYRIFDERRPKVVFHAAALKHLPMLEQYPAEAVKTNVVGTRNVLEAARRVEVERFVNISTDKAADPTSILGFSKRAAERLTAHYAKADDGVYLSVRFGNVLGSRGSVLATFAGQIARGGPVTVTHPEVTRYFMTVSEAVQLVLQAGAIGQDGEVLILDMGEPVRIEDVARELIRQSGREIEIVYTGLRDGEKLDEILRSDEESDVRPCHELISHVAVAPLGERALGGVPPEMSKVEARSLLQGWCVTADAGGRVDNGLREPVILEGKAIQMTSMVDDNAVVLVTGGTGSFGSTMVRRLLGEGVGEIRILSRDELKQHEMRTSLSDDRVRFYIGDVRDFDSVERATRGVNLVFHAAALKQVPSCEFFPMEAVRTNVLGSSNVIEASHANGVDSVVCLGTDKAVYPVNAMGMSKAMMEKTAQAFARNNPTAKTVVSTVRYGNVMCSRGSVIPLFVEQAKSGGPLTVTDPSMTRFLMSLEEAIMLVEHAFTNAKPGDLFVRKAPASTVADLAEAVAQLVGVEPEIKVIGTRHGEKLFETLATREELVRAKDQGDFFRVPVDSRDLNYQPYFDEGDTAESSVDDYHSHNTVRLDVAEVRKLLKNLSSFQNLLD